MGAIIGVLGRLIAWAGASFITYRATELAEPVVKDLTKEPTVQELKAKTEGQSPFNRWWTMFKLRWKSNLLIALLSGIVIYLVLYLFKNIKFKK